MQRYDIIIAFIKSEPFIVGLLLRLHNNVISASAQLLSTPMRVNGLTNIYKVISLCQFADRLNG